MSLQDGSGQTPSTSDLGGIHRSAAMIANCAVTADAPVKYTALAATAATAEAAHPWDG
jgi:hypothetical protein